MDFLTKIERVKEHLASWQEEWGDEFAYIVSEFGTENTETWEENVYLGKHEHQYILDYLASKGYLELSTSEKGSLHIKMLPKIEPKIKLKTLELMARDLKDYYTGNTIVDFLKGEGVDPKLIIYPQTKWLIFYGVFKELALSKNKKDCDLLFKIICNVLHPLNFGGSRELPEMLRENFNKCLEYDGLVIGYSDEEKKYGIWKINSGLDEEDTFQMLNEDLFIQEQEELEFLRRPENKEKISTLRKAYQVFMNIAEVFCDNPSKPSHELNDAYLQTKKLVTDTVANLHLHVSSVNGIQRIHTLTHYCIPFNNLFTAEKEYTPGPLELDLTGKKLNWDYIRPQMHATYGCIDELYRKVDGSDVLSKPDVQQTLNDVSLLLAKTKEENAKRVIARQRAFATPPSVQKVEITAMPVLKIRGEKESVHKTAKTTLRGKHIELDETRSAVIVDGKPYQLPPAQNEDSLARVMFRHQVGESVDWSMLYSEMTGVDPQETDIENPKNMKMVRDTMNRMNSRLQELLNTKDKLLVWKNKSICRNY